MNDRLIATPSSQGGFDTVLALLQVGGPVVMILLVILVILVMSVTSSDKLPVVMLLDPLRALGAKQVSLLRAPTKEQG